MKIKVKVKPSSGKQETEKIFENKFKVYLKSVPENNNAKIELEKLLQKYFNGEARIVLGFKSRKKIVEVK